MKINEKSEKLKIAKQEALKIVQEAQDKGDGIVQAIEKMNEAYNEELINQLVLESNSKKEQESEKDFCERMGLRNLSQKEKEFYEKLVNNPKQAIEAGQIDIFPTSIIDLTLEDVRKESILLSHINFAPAGVKRWLVADKTGNYSWGSALTVADIVGEVQAKFNSMTTEVNRLTVFMILPKAIRELALPFVDKYCRAVLKEQLIDGLEYGAIQGRGTQQNEPIGMFKLISEANTDGTNKDKALNTTLTSFSPLGMADAKIYLTKDGKRKLTQIIVVCNPADRAHYIDPAMQDRRGETIASAKDLIVAESAQCPVGKAGLFLSKKYTLAMANLTIKDYDQTLADKDADLLIGGTFANGRAVDDNSCFVFDVTKLEEFVDSVSVKGIVNTQEVPVA